MQVFQHQKVVEKVVWIENYSFDSFVSCWQYTSCCCDIQTPRVGGGEDVAHVLVRGAAEGLKSMPC